MLNEDDFVNSHQVDLQPNDVNQVYKVEFDHVQKKMDDQILQLMCKD
jgi:hypothetical protein